MANTGLIITVVIFVLFFVWVAVFSALAVIKRKPIFEKLSIVAPLGMMVHNAVENGPKYQIVKNANYVNPFKKQAPVAQPTIPPQQTVAAPIPVEPAQTVQPTMYEAPQPAF
jgi:hypothetical protein